MLILAKIVACVVSLMPYKHAKKYILIGLVTHEIDLNVGFIFVAPWPIGNLPIENIYR